MNTNNSKIIISLVAIVAVAGISGTIFAFNEDSVQVTNIHSSSHYMDLELLSTADYAIIGKVVDINPVKQEDRHGNPIIFSEVTIEVEKDLSERYAEKQITVLTRGGELDGFKTISEGDPEFEENERVLIFVAEKEPSSIWGDNYYVAGLYQGKYSLADGKAFGQEYVDGIDETQFISNIQQLKGSN